MSEPKKVYAAIAAVMADLSKEGIAKDRKNEGQKFMFRGVDDAYNALSPVFAAHRLMMLPRVLSRHAEVRDTKNGGTMQYVVVDMEFDLVSAEDGSAHTIRTVGEAMDSGDKATNKAMSAAFKYAAFQAFCIPTEGDNDADAANHQLAPQTGVQPQGGRVPDGEPWLRHIGLSAEGIEGYYKDCRAKGLEPFATAKNARGAQVRNVDQLITYVADQVKQGKVPA